MNSWVDGVGDGCRSKHHIRVGSVSRKVIPLSRDVDGRANHAGDPVETPIVVPATRTPYSVIGAPGRHSIVPAWGFPPLWWIRNSG